MSISSSLAVAVDVRYGLLEIDIAYCMNMQNLKLEGAAMKDNQLCNIISELLLLECLCLYYCDTGEKLKISSASHKRLEIHNCDGLVELKIDSSASLKTLKICQCDELVELKVDSPNLSHFTYDGDMINVCSNALALSSLELDFFNQAVVDKQWYVKFVELFAQLHDCSEMLSLRDFNFNDEVFVASKELRQILPSPFFSGQRFKIQLINLSLLFWIAKVVDELLWIAPHTKTLFIEFYSFHGCCTKTAFEFSYKKPTDYEGEYACCCKSFPILCWQHYIENAKVEVSHFSGTVTKCYCLEGAKFLEKIDGLCGLKKLFKCT